MSHPGASASVEPASGPPTSPLVINLPAHATEIHPFFDLWDKDKSTLCEWRFTWEQESLDRMAKVWEDIKEAAVKEGLIDATELTTYAYGKHEEVPEQLQGYWPTQMAVQLIVWEFTVAGKQRLFAWFKCYPLRVSREWWRVRFDNFIEFEESAEGPSLLAERTMFVMRNADNEHVADFFTFDSATGTIIEAPEDDKYAAKIYLDLESRHRKRNSDFGCIRVRSDHEIIDREKRMLAMQKRRQELTDQESEDEDEFFTNDSETESSTASIDDRLKFTSSGHPILFYDSSDLSRKNHILYGSQDPSEDKDLEGFVVPDTPSTSSDESSTLSDGSSRSETEVGDSVSESKESLEASESFSGCSSEADEPMFRDPSIDRTETSSEVESTYDLFGATYELYRALLWMRCQPVKARAGEDADAKSAELEKRVLELVSRIDPSKVHNGSMPIPLLPSSEGNPELKMEELGPNNVESTREYIDHRLRSTTPEPPDVAGDSNDELRNTIKGLEATVRLQGARIVELEKENMKLRKKHMLEDETDEARRVKSRHS
ncbi:uncharacterized protein K452DRAFT_322215 [Aplosporella prunicola CBS 121167]|uniref:Uncharacterized protein n=1 Tax=Aplosporella prunicola CBS 121167 TaxID=1176127 RepID=A0A6A6B197_9PEZI|nr:uncharacterized protein K452DRAFT_322629 [Aplosporella prunicola CBS 121167]XP_033392515.1 uncharacterized protein K452DRAFT_322215 [Aplosporella prunicola CBS 121167]KAF2136128.1 hypothetical protein K452DRAFT_322629 [Aplosporella prunicola CBS 121167]KAF2136797.1 hypothetical protein K452DRAFT_322215 [Aplosporella prunicola CBS 121167]